MKKLTNGLIGYVFLSALSHGVLHARECLPITDATKQRIVAYVERRHGLRGVADLDWVIDRPIGHTCYRRVTFQIRGVVPTITLDYVLAPDHQFLSQEMLDTTAQDDGRQSSEAAVSVVSTADTRPATLPETVGEFKGDPPESDGAAGDYPSIGAKDAPVTVTVFTDFQCPYCRQAAATLRHFSSDTVRIVVRNWPLPMHSWSRQAAESAQCAYRQQGDKAFWIVHDFLFEHQDEITPEMIDTRLRDVVGAVPGIAIREYDDCLKQHLSLPAIERDISYAVSRGFRGTPTIIINGARQDGVLTPERLKEVIDSANKTGLPQGKGN